MRIRLPFLPSGPTRPVLLGLLALVAAAGSATGQAEAPPSFHVDLELDTGVLVAQGASRSVVASYTVQVDNATWLRLYFDEITLGGDLLAGTGSVLRITSHLDGHVQELNAQHAAQWQNSTAYFNGPAVQLDLIAEPGTRNALQLRSADAGLPYAPSESICGATDDRVLSSDPRVGRLMPVGCTGWLIDDCQGCALTAGHCTGGISVLQFNVPQSNSNGSTVNPGPQDQYAVDPASLQTNGGGGVGNDWGTFGTFPNANTGLTAAQAAGDTLVLGSPPASPGGQSIRITGYGTDSTPLTSNQVQQTHVGPMVTSTQTLVQYVTDTTGGNSGSPVIWEDTGLAVGIHSHGGCGSDGGQNSGTSSTHPGLQAALANPQGICAAGVAFAGAPTFLSPVTPTAFTVQVNGDPVAGSVLLNYRFGPGPFTSLPMVDQGGDMYTAQLPPPACDDVPEYFFSVVDASCGVLFTPDLGPDAPFTGTVSEPQLSFADDFEADLGWSATSIGATTGFWERGVPVNDPNWPYDPISDGDGSGQCYLTQNQFGNTDVDDGSVILTSPPFAWIGGQAGFLSYWSYLFLNNETGSDSLVTELSVGGGPWALVAIQTTSTGTDWVQRFITADDLAAAGIVPGDDMRVRFIATDAGSPSIVEAGIDGFRAGAATCSPNLGENFCVSGAFGSEISALGTTSVALNNVTLQATAPNFAIGQFLYGGFSTQTPLGAGSLCVTNGSGAFRLPLAYSGASGLLTLQLDLTAPPSPFGTILPGSTWNFQALFRVLGTVDTSDALSISFTL